MIQRQLSRLRVNAYMDARGIPGVGADDVRPHDPKMSLPKLVKESKDFTLSDSKKTSVSHKNEMPQSQSH